MTTTNETEQSQNKNKNKNFPTVWSRRWTFQTFHAFQRWSWTLKARCRLEPCCPLLSTVHRCPLPTLRQNSSFPCHSPHTYTSDDTSDDTSSVFFQMTVIKAENYYIYNQYPGLTNIRIFYSILLSCRTFDRIFRFFCLHVLFMSSSCRARWIESMRS